MMFGIHLGFAEPGDQYIDCLLAELDPNKSEFAGIPLHFVCETENEYVCKAMYLCFKGIIDQIEGDIVENNEEHNAINYRIRRNLKI